MKEDFLHKGYVLEKSYLYSAMTDTSFDVHRLFTTNRQLEPVTPQFITSLNH